MEIRITPARAPDADGRLDEAWPPLRRHRDRWIVVVLALVVLLVAIMTVSGTADALGHVVADALPGTAGAGCGGG